LYLLLLSRTIWGGTGNLPVSAGNLPVDSSSGKLPDDTGQWPVPPNQFQVIGYRNWKELEIFRDD